MVYDDKVATVSTRGEGFGFIVQSREFADTFRGYFDFMWGVASKTPDGAGR
jgi:hypothetical protein